MRHNRLAALAVTIAAVACLCPNAPAADTSTGEAAAVPTFDYSRIANPVWSLPDKHLRDPAAVVVDGVVYLYFTYYDPAARTWHIGMSTTRDFLEFAPIELVSPEGYASPGNVIRYDGKWVLCYQQYREFPHYLCLAFSDDLRTWSEPQRIFNTGPENTWNVDKRVIDPFIVENEGTFYCYYVGSTRWGKPSGHNLIGVATSKDLKTWTDATPEAPAIGVDFEWEGPDGNENNYVLRREDRWFMLYSASLKNQKIAYAWSDDLIHWEKGGLCDVPVFDASATGFGAPILLEGITDNGKHYMLYQGRDLAGHMSFLLLESDDLIHWR